VIIIDYFVLKGVPISDQEHLNQLHFLESFWDVVKNTLIDRNDDIIDYFEIIDYIGYLIDYRQLQLFSL